MAKKKRKQRGDTMQDVTQKPQASEAEEAVETMEAAVETAMDADEAHEQAKEEMAPGHRRCRSGRGARCRHRQAGRIPGHGPARAGGL